MCGIAGIHGQGIAPTIPSLLIQAIAHRGPDQPAQYGRIGDYIGAACRLSIVDVAHGTQPMLNQEQTICVSMNGELYNHAALRKELERKGHCFLSSCDTEVVLRAYEEYGIACVQRFQGMFAIALYDLSFDALYLIRDSSGIKPLYYLRTREGQLAYSSEMKSFFAAHLATGRVNDEYLLSRFIFSFGPANQTLFTDILPVIPGSYLMWHQQQLTSQAYQPLVAAVPEHMSEQVEEILDQLKARLEQAVLAQIPHEVPYGVFLSGGVDSSILAYMVAMVAQCDQGPPPCLFTVSDQSETADRQSAREVAAHLQMPLVDLSMTAEEMLRLFPHFLLSLEEFEPLNIFWYVLASRAKDYIKVALCGQGADEVFGGYPAYRQPELLYTAFARRYASVHALCSSTLQEQATTLITQLQAPDGKETLYRVFLQDQLVSYQLGPVDRCTMAHGIEARVPYLDEVVIAYARALPPDVRLGGPMEKWPLRMAFSSSGLPTLNRRKQFSGATTFPRFAQQIHALADSLISDAQYAAHPYRPVLRSKAEMLSFDVLLAVLVEGRGSLPTNFSVSQLYC